MILNDLFMFTQSHSKSLSNTRVGVESFISLSEKVGNGALGSMHSTARRHT